jgi:hypothetical protein
MCRMETVALVLGHVRDFFDKEHTTILQNQQSGLAKYGYYSSLNIAVNDGGVSKAAQHWDEIDNLAVPS